MVPKIHIRWLCVGAIVSLLGFVALLVILAQGGQVTRKEALTYVPYSEGIADELILQGSSSVPLDVNTLPDGSNLHALTLQTKDVAKWTRADRVGLELSGFDARGTFKIARLVIKDREGGNAVAVFGTLEPGPSPNDPILILERSAWLDGDVPAGVVPGIAVLEIIATTPFELLLQVQSSRNEPLSHLLWVATQQGSDMKVLAPR
jgi:hypothetical protein